MRPLPMCAVRAMCAMTLLAMAAVATTPTAATTLWRTPWLVEAPPQLMGVPFNGSPNLHGIAFADDGDLLVGHDSLYGYADEFVTRFGTDGTLRWSGVVHAYETPAAIVPLPDGGAFATFSTDGIWGGFAARLDANGSVLWARDTPARWIIPIDDGRVAVSDCESAAMLDAASGVVLWHHAVGANTGCDGGGLVVDGSTMYTIALHEPDYLHVSQRLVAFDLDGHTRWQTTLAETEPTSLIGIGGGLLYLHENSETIAIRASDGSIAWRAPVSGWNLAGSPPEPIVATPDGLQRLDGASGAARWTTPVGTYVEAIGTVGNSVVTVSSTGLSRIDAESGAIVWTVALPQSGSGGNYLDWDTIGGLAGNGVFSVVARDGLSIFVQRVDFSTGALVGSAQAPSITQGVHSFDTTRDGSDVVSLHFDYSNVLRMVDVDAQTGAIRWNVATALADGLGLVGFDYNSLYAIGPTRVAAAVPLNNPGPTPTSGEVEVVSYDRATGSQAWHSALYDFGESATSVATPIVDAAGNVVVSIAMNMPCNELTCPQQSIMKVAAADGSVLWRVDNAPPFGSNDPKPILAIGDDVLVRAPFAGSTATIRRLSGSDGSVQWESDVFAEAGVANLYRLDESRLVAFEAASDAYRWAALDAATGAVLWTSSAPCADLSANCYGGDAVVTSSGAIAFQLQLGDDTGLAELADDGSGGFAAWPVADTRADLTTWLSDLVEETDGTLGYMLAHTGNWMSAGSWFRRFDPAAGANVSSQHLPGAPLGAADGSAMVLDTATLDAEPSGSVISREDVTIHAHGNLAAAVTLDSDVASPGRPLGFHLAVTYAGDVALSGVKLRGIMRWASGVTDLSCAGSGVSNCVLDASRRDVDAMFDIAPGGALEISGRILPLDFPGDGSQRWIGARVLGPSDLDEADTTDNFARAGVVQALFADGFEAP